MDSFAPLKVLILDDEQDFLDVCRQWLSGLPSRPEIFSANTGSYALALLESEPISLLLTDLRMPNMDGFQVLAIVRRRFPSLRIVVMTGAAEEQFRARAYAMGIDLYVEKPKGFKETKLFLDCIEAMLERRLEMGGGFHGMQNKPLVDIIQMECLTQSSGVLKISSGTLSGLIWLDRGSIVDAACGSLTAEPAFREILAWKIGSFELLPPEPAHQRTIFTSAQGLLLDIAQSIDEASAEAGASAGSPGEPSKLARLARTKGVEFLVCRDETGNVQAWSCENAEAMAAWAQQVFHDFCAVAELLKAGDPVRIEGLGSQWHVAVGRVGKSAVVAGFDRRLTSQQVSETAKQILSQWES